MCFKTPSYLPKNSRLPKIGSQKVSNCQAFTPQSAKVNLTRRWGGRAPRFLITNRGYSIFAAEPNVTALFYASGDLPDVQASWWEVTECSDEPGQKLSKSIA